MLIGLRPNIHQLGDRGILLLVRFLSSTAGYKYLFDSGFVTNQLHNWGVHFNFR